MAGTIKPIIPPGLYRETIDTSGSPGGASGTLQYNNSSAFGGISGWTTNGTTALTGAANTTLAIGGATIGSNALAVTGTTLLNNRLTITQGTANQAVLASTGYSLTGSDATSMVSLAGTWNTTGAPTALSLRITNTASDAASLLFDFGTSAGALATLRIDGAMRLLKGYSATNYHIGNASGGISWSGGDAFFCQSGSAIAAFTGTNGLIMSGTRGIGFTSGAADAGNNDAFFMRKAAATIQMGADAAGVTNQMFTAANRITSDGVGANLTIAAGNGRGGAAGNLILSSWTTGAAGAAGVLTTMLTIDISRLTIASGKALRLGVAASAEVLADSTHTLIVEDSAGTQYKLMAVAA